MLSQKAEEEGEEEEEKELRNSLYSIFNWNKLDSSV